MPASKKDKIQAPKTALDEKFLAITGEVMAKHGIKSDRAISVALDRHPDFINRIRRGLQSAPADAWDTLMKKYPEAQNITNTTVTAHSVGQAVGTVHGDNVYAPTTLESCQRDLASSRAEVEQLKQQLLDKDKLIASQEATIASKDEIISLLRSKDNRPT